MNRRTLIAGLALLPGFAQAQARDPQRLRVALLPDENASTIIQNAQPLRALAAAAAVLVLAARFGHDVA
jgi:phosphonate transport system substrate-binding protein